MTRDSKFQAESKMLGHSFDGEIKIGGNYVPIVRDQDQIFVSRQIPRVGNEVVVTGAAGSDVDLTRAQMAAKICVMRALALLQRSLGSLDKIKAIQRITVFVRSASDFTQQSEVADGASEVLFRILGEAGAHTRTSVGVLQLPKGATVEIDLIASARPSDAYWLKTSSKCSACGHTMNSFWHRVVRDVCTVHHGSQVPIVSAGATAPLGWRYDSLGPASQAADHQETPMTTQGCVVTHARDAQLHKGLRSFSETVAVDNVHPPA